MVTFMYFVAEKNRGNRTSPFIVTPRRRAGKEAGSDEEFSGPPSPVSNQARGTRPPELNVTLNIISGRRSSLRHCPNSCPHGQRKECLTYAVYQEWPPFHFAER